MKANANKRKIFDAVDLLTEDTSAQTTEVKAEKGIRRSDRRKGGRDFGGIAGETY